VEVAALARAEVPLPCTLFHCTYPRSRPHKPSEKLPLSQRSQEEGRRLLPAVSLGRKQLNPLKSSELWLSTCITSLIAGENLL